MSTAPQYRLSRLATLLACVLSLVGCTAAEPPDRLPVLQLHGTPYQRGVQHGRALSSQIRSFYTTMLQTSLLPYLNREQSDIAAFLKSYDPKLHPEYGDGQFSLQLLLESARAVEQSIPQPLRDEMRGIADGAGVPYDEVLLLNTFVDSTMGARAVTAFLRQMQAPSLQWLQVMDASGPPASSELMATDQLDNDGDGATDEANEARVDYTPRPTASLREVPASARFRLLLQDPDGVDPQSVRVHLVVNGAGQVYTASNPALQIAPFVAGNGEVQPDLLQVVFTPPSPLPAAAVVTLAVQASDKKILENPPPARARTMRIEQFTLTTKGHGQPLSAVPNLGALDGTTQPPSTAWAVRGKATPDGAPRLAHHFSLLDAGTSHKHCVIQVHHPVDGPSFTFAGWAGLVYGFSGLSARGVAVAATHADTLNNPLVANVQKDLLSAKLVTRGLPIGFALRRVLQEAHTSQEAADLLLAVPHTFGWNVVLADKAGDLRALELNSAIDPAQPQPLAYTPTATDAEGRYISSSGGDDILTSVHYRALADDLQLQVLVFTLPPQRFWSSYYYPSLRAFAALKEAIASRYGQLDRATIETVLRLPVLIDRNDSMQASVVEPVTRRFSVAAGQVPATKGHFLTVELPPWSGP